ncbi:MAG: NADH-quinone oxidoreductase subunit J [Acidobacteriaceae bacterium]
MTASFIFLAVLTVAGTAAAMGLRNAVHCVLALTLGLTGIAMLYLQLDAQFVGFTQIMVYVGAVAILAVFVIMMTRNDKTVAPPALSYSGVAGGLIAAAVFAVLAWAICSSASRAQGLPAQPDATVQQIGDALLHRYVLPLEIMGLLLTAALIGAVVIAMDRGEEMK